MKLVVLGSLGAALLSLAQVAFAQSGETLETSNNDGGEEVRVKASNFKDQRVKDLLTPNNLSPEVSFRCGMFYAPKQEGRKPKAKIFILPKRFKIEPATFAEYNITGGDDLSCGNNIPDTEPNKPMDQYCFKLFEKFVQNNDMSSDSKVRDPKKYTMGDDLCEYLTKVGVPKNKAPPNKNFPKGIQVGFYYNKCTDKQWYDTRLRMTQTVCCKLDEAGDVLKYSGC